MARKLTGFLNWHGVPCQIFNVGKYRRLVVETTTTNSNADADFFDSKNKEACALREKAAYLALQDMLKWLDNEQEDETECDDSDARGGGGKDETECDDDDNGDDDDVVAQQQRSFSSMNPECLMSERFSPVGRTTNSKRGGTSKGKTLPQLDHSTSYIPDIVTKEQLLKRERIAIFDATNSTNARRQWILDMCTNPEKRGEDKPTGCVFIESICDDEELLMENYLDKISNSPDYANMYSKDEAIKDLKQRVRKYEEQYETITTDELSYIKVYNLSSKIMANQIYGRMSKLIVPASK